MRHDYKTGYKVVWVRGSQLESAVEFNKYGVGFESKPFKKRGPLAVFVDLQSAISFFTAYEKYLRVYKCKYTRSKKQYLYDGKTKFTDVPPGTDFATTVILTEEIQLNDHL